MKKRTKFILIVIVFALLLLASILVGPVSISLSDLCRIISGQEVNEIYNNILWQIRFPKMITAVMAGAALATSGLIMQTYFQNPLAGPFVLGINNGASLGVAIWMFGISTFGITSKLFLNIGIIGFAVLGSLSVLFVLLFLSFKIKGKVVILVIGLIFGHMSNGLINILMNVGNAESVKGFLVWGLGSFAKINESDLSLFVLIIFFTIIFTLFLVKQLNVMLLGERYAKSLGINVRTLKLMLISITAILSGTVTAFCGPIAFIGIIIPHVARTVFKSSDHRITMPASIILGSSVALCADFMATSDFVFSIPVNATMGLLGAPVIMMFLWNRRHAEGAL